MRTEPVSFYSQGLKISALWRTPSQPPAHMRAVVQGPGWLGLKDAKLYVRYHEALTEAGFGVLVFDYRGFGDSEGDRCRLSPRDQLEDLRAAVTYLSSREDVDADRIGAFGSGGTGGGNAILLAAADPRVRAVVCQLPVADGADWLHRMRSEDDWLAFLRGLADDRRERVLNGGGRLVNPREEIMVPTAERKATTIKADVDERIPIAISLQAADEILEYRPLEAAIGLRTPLMVIAVENDATTPTDHAYQLYEAAAGPKELLVQRHTSHYAAYDRYWSLVTPKLVQWFDRHLDASQVMVRSAETGGADSIEWLQLDGPELN